jgi:transcriptional regulator with XRE-family HTH domain
VEKLEFASRLRLVLQGRSQKEFAESIGDDQEKLSKYLNSVQMPGYLFWKRMAEAGYNVNWLLTGKGGMYISDADETNLSPELRAMAQKLAGHPELVSTLGEMIELREKLDRTKQELKMEFQRMKKK